MYPYSDEVAIQNQIGLYGRLAEGLEDLIYYKNPIYSILFLVPFSWLSYDWAISVWIVLNIILVILCLKVSFPGISPLIIIAFLFSYQVGFCLIEGNFSLLTGLSLVYVINFILYTKTRPSKQVQYLCGFFLLIATFKPQFSWLFVSFILIYCVSRKYISVLVSFAGCLLILGGAMLIWYPTWPVDLIRLILDYSLINLPVRYQLLSLIVPTRHSGIWGNILLIIILILTIYQVWKYFFGMKPIDNSSMITLLALTTYISHPSGFSSEQILLLIPVIFWIVAEELGKGRCLWFGIGMLLLSYLPFFLDRKYPGLRLIVILPLIIYIFWFLATRYRPWIHSARGRGGE